MKRLSKYIEFVNENNPALNNNVPSVGDLVNVELDGNIFIAKVIKIVTQDSIIVNLENNGIIDPKPVKISVDQINNTVKANEEPAMGGDAAWSVQKLPSNDMVINNYGSTSTSTQNV